MNATALITVFVVAVVPLVPTEAVLVGMGVLAASTGVSLLGVIAVATVGCSLSDHVLYLLGRVAGERILGWWGDRSSGAAAMTWLTRNITRWGSPVLVAGRWVPGGGTVGAVLVGMLRWRLRRFTPTSAVGSMLWSTYAALLGYFGGSVTGRPVTGLLLSLAVAAVVGLFTRVVIRRAQRPVVDDQPGPGEPCSHYDACQVPSSCALDGGVRPVCSSVSARD
ncbi:MAG: putative rane protein [Dactylosporangium sp.]|jgi:membrane-associated protein|nr:putative rane protein [Dactylosporangium sp.]